MCTSRKDKRWSEACHMAPCVSSPPSSPLLTPSSSPHQDTLVLVNSGFKRNAALLWFSAGPVLKAGTYCLSVALWSGRGKPLTACYTHTPLKPHPLLLPPPEPSSPRSPHAHSYHHETRLKNEKFLPLQAPLQFITSSSFMLSHH